MSAFFTALGGFGRTFGTTMNANVQKSLFYARSRKYETNLEAALNAPNIPVPVLHAARRRRQPAPADVPPLSEAAQADDGVTDVCTTTTFTRRGLVGQPALHAGRGAEPRHRGDGPARRRLHRRAPARVQRAVAGLVPDRRQGLRCLFERRRYDVHPFMLLNYLGQYNDVSTLAHELATRCTATTRTRRSRFDGGYPTFVAEVASTFNEALLIDHMLKQIKDAPTRLALLGNYLEGIKATVFRQTQFAEFELRMHELGQKGEPITGRRAGEAVSRYHPQVLRPRPEDHRRRRLHRPRVDLHSAFLPGLLRVPVRDLVHGG